MFLRAGALDLASFGGVAGGAARRRVRRRGRHAARSSSLGSRVRLQAAIVKVNCRPTRPSPRCLVLRRPAVALAQPKASLIRFRIT